MSEHDTEYRVKFGRVEFDSHGGWVLRGAVQLTPESVAAVAQRAAAFAVRNQTRRLFVVEVRSFVKDAPPLVGWTESELNWDTIVRDRQGNIVVRRRLEIRGTFD